MAPKGGTAASAAATSTSTTPPFALRAGISTFVLSRYIGVAGDHESRVRTRSHRLKPYCSTSASGGGAIA